MAYGGYTYIETDYEPDPENDIIVWHWVKGTEPIEKLAEALAAESSVGTWTKLETVNMEVFEKLRDCPRTAAIPVVFMTGMVEEKDLGPGSMIAGNLFLTKPFTLRDAVHMIEQALASR